MTIDARVPQNTTLTTTSQPCVGVPPSAVDVEDLTWRLLDEQLEKPQFDTLERELVNNENSRKTYIDCVQLHVDLMYYFNDKHNAEHPDQAKPLLPLPFGQ